MTKFTDVQMLQFKRYVKVQKSAKHNMLSREAQQACSLDRDEMAFVMKNYKELAKQAEELL